MLTAPYFHAGILHILMNMLSFTSIGGWLVRHTPSLGCPRSRLTIAAVCCVAQESKCGTFYFTLTILWATILSNLIYVTVCWWGRNMAPYLTAIGAAAHWHCLSVWLLGVSGCWRCTSRVTTAGSPTPASGSAG